MDDKNNILDEELIIDKGKQLFVLKAQRAEIMGRLKIPKYILFFIGFLTLTSGDPLSIGIGILYIVCGFLLQKFPISISIIAAILVTLVSLNNVYYYVQDMNISWGMFIPILFCLILWVAVLNAFRHDKLDKKIKEME